MDIMPINKSSYTAKVVGVPYTIDHSAVEVYSQGFESFTAFDDDPDGWTNSASGACFVTDTSDGPYPRTGTKCLRYNIDATKGVVTRPFTGLIVGRSYTFEAWILNFNFTGTAKVQVSGIADDSGTSMSGSYTLLSRTFTAMSSTHTISMKTLYPAGGSVAFSDDITLTGAAFTETLFGDYDLEVKSAEVTLDETRAPYVQADLTCALPSFVALENIDPRLNLRVTVTATQEWIQPVRDPQTRTFDLLLHERTIDHESAELTLRLVSDEATLIDGGNDTTSATRTYGLSVKSAVDATLTGHSFALEAGALDATLAANPPTLPVITNIIVNPTFRTSLGNWVAGGSGNTIARLTGLVNSPVPGVTTYSRTTWTAAGTGGIYSRADTNAPYIDVTAGLTYVISAWVRANVARVVSMNVQWLGAPTFIGSAVPLVANEWTHIVQRVTAPVGATRAGLFCYALVETWVAGNTFDTLGWSMTLDTAYPFFDGETVDTGLDTYAWTGTAGASASTRTNLLNSDVFIQTPGTLDWDYVAPLVQAGGLRLFCDEQRKWRLIDPLTYTVPGQINVAAGTNVTSGKDTISRQQEDWFDAVVVEYRWTDDAGLPQVAYDAASGGGTKLLRKVVERPFPGAGAAASILSLYSGRGRTLDVEALTDLTVTPGMALVMTMPGTPIQVGVVSSVTWKWSAEGDSDEMRIGSRGLLDTPSTAWLLQPEGYKWQDIPVGQSWPEYETPS